MRYVLFLAVHESDNTEYQIILCYMRMICSEKMNLFVRYFYCQLK